MPAGDNLQPIRHTSIMTLHSLIWTCDYGQDVGNLHVIDYYLYTVALALAPWPFALPPHLRISPADWSR